MTNEDRLSGPKVRVCRHQRVAGRSCLAHESGDHVSDRSLKERNAPPEIQAEVQRDLLVPRPARVQALPRVAELLDEQPLDETVHIFVLAIEEGRLGAAAVEKCPEFL